ncbi:MAG: sulfatase-like hydrolase/transferase, partial [Bacteroidota bacterium]
MKPLCGTLLTLIFYSLTAWGQFQPPHIILIMADDLGYEALACNGGPYQTPHLDRLAREGMRFTQAYATPLCTPSRVQLMTGKYNHRNYRGFGILDSGETTFAHHLKRAGYHTYVAGKWQLWGNKTQVNLAGQHGSRPEQMGFDGFCLWQVEDRGPRFKSPLLETLPGGLQAFPEGYGPDIFVDSLLGFFQQHKNEPVLLYYPMCLTHDPYRPTPDQAEAYEAYQTGTPLNDTSYFADNVAYMDKMVGRLVDRVKELSLERETLLLFVGDNGMDRDVYTAWQGRYQQGRKGYPVEYGTHVPMIAYWPGTIAPGQVNHQLVDLTDFFPTMVEAAGSSLPEELDGLSFFPALVGEKAPTRAWIFCHYDPRWGRFKKVTYAQDTYWKLYADGRLYRFKADPEEQQPIETTQATLADERARKRLQSVLNRMTH